MCMFLSFLFSVLKVRFESLRNILSLQIISLVSSMA